MGSLSALAFSEQRNTSRRPPNPGHALPRPRDALCLGLGPAEAGFDCFVEYRAGRPFALGDVDDVLGSGVGHVVDGPRVVPAHVGAEHNIRLGEKGVVAGRRFVDECIPSSGHGSFSLGRRWPQAG